jgi:hypothetical protein
MPTVRCPGCRRTHDIRADNIACQFGCPHCSTRFVVNQDPPLLCSVCNYRGTMPRNMAGKPCKCPSCKSVEKLPLIGSIVERQPVAADVEQQAAQREQQANRRSQEPWFYSRAEEVESALQWIGGGGLAAYFVTGLLLVFGASKTFATIEVTILAVLLIVSAVLMGLGIALSSSLVLILVDIGRNLRAIRDDAHDKKQQSNSN